jgi:hypothetical protein
MSRVTAQRRYKEAHGRGLVSILEVRKRSGRQRKVILRKIAEMGISVEDIGGWRYIRPEDAERVMAALDGQYSLVGKSWGEVGLTEREMGWLGGIWDGEGTISISPPREGKQVSGANVSVCNTDPRLSGKVVEILQKMGVEFTVGNDISKNEKWKDRIEVRVNKAGSIWRLCQELLPFLVNKRERAELMLEFSKKRAANANRKGFGGTTKEYAARFASLGFRSNHCQAWSQRKA